MRAMILALLIAVAPIIPALAHAQYVEDTDIANPYEYQDVEDAQLLKLAAYILTPIGMGLEWGVMRPLHHAATQTSWAPILSGDKDSYQFGENNNSDFVPPGTFDPEPINLSNTFVPAEPPPVVSKTRTHSINRRQSSQPAMQ